MAEDLENIYHYQFIHNCLADFYHDILQFFAVSVYPRFNYSTVGTYDKAVEYITQKTSNSNRELDTPILPAIILNPLGELNIADGIGKALWRFPNLGSGLGSKLFDPLYYDSNVQVNVVFTRYAGEIELVMLCRSIYEYLDLRVLFLQMFGGYERPIYPQTFNSFIILPNSVYSYRYTNEYTGADYILDWSNYSVNNQLVRTINTNNYVYTCVMSPRFHLTSLADASSRYGGTDKVAEYKLSATLQYEVELPTYMAIKTDFAARGMRLNLMFGSSYSAYPDYQPPVNTDALGTEWSSIDTTATIVYRDYMILHNRYYHEVTAEEVDSTADIIFDLPETVTDPDLLYVNSKHGKLNYKDHYDIINSGTQIQIHINYVTLTSGMIIELYYYVLH